MSMPSIICSVFLRKTKFSQKIGLHTNRGVSLNDCPLFGDDPQECFDYIEGFYNRRRIHSALDNKSPEEYEK